MADKTLSDLTRAIEETLLAPLAGEDLLPQLQDLMQQLRSVAEQSEDLRRYRATRARMGTRSEYFLAPPNFPYTIHSA